MPDLNEGYLMASPQKSMAVKEPQSAQKYNKGLKLRLEQSSAMHFSKLSSITDREVEQINSRTKAQ